MYEAKLIETKSFFARNNQFKKNEDGKLLLRPFIDASRDIVKFVDLLGPLFLPVSKDIKGNIGKIGDFILHHCENICYVNQIVEYEKLNIQDEDKRIGTDAILWLKRSLEYVSAFLFHFYHDYSDKKRSENLDEYFNSAYEDTLQQHHNWFVRKLFYLCMKAIPNRTRLLELLGKNETITEEIIFEDIKNYRTTLQGNIDLINKIFDDHQLVK